MQQYKVVKVDVSPEEAYKKQKKQNRLLVLFILLLILGFIVYEVKFAEKGIFNKGDKYEEYDPNYVIEDNSNVKQDQSNSNVESNTTVVSNVIESNSNTTSNIISNSNSTSTSNKASNTVKDTTKPTITSISFTNLTDTSVTVNISANDNLTSSAKLKKSYSVDNKNWQTSNVLKNLKGNTNYTVYVKVTDDAGNVSNTYNKSLKTYTTVSSIPNGVFGSYKVYSISSNEIAIYDGGWKYAKLSSNSTWYRTYKSSNGTYTYMENKLNNKAYSSTYTLSNIKNDLFGYDYQYNDNSICNGYYKGSRGNIYFMPIGQCDIYFDIDYGKKWHSGGYYTPTASDFTIVWGSQAGVMFKFKASFTNDGKTVTVTNADKDELIEKEKTSVINNSSGVYTKVKSLTINDAIKLKIKGDLN